MTAEERRQVILDHLRLKETARVDELAELTGVSRMTIHRDLDDLVDQKIIRKVHGGATMLPSVVFEGDYTYRSRLAAAEKDLLARAAAEAIEPGMALLLDDSSTTHHLLPHLAARKPLTVITNALAVIQALSRMDGISLISLGGRFDPVSNAFLGLVCEQGLRTLRADLAILSTAAIQGGGAYLHDPEIVRAKQAMLAAADRSHLLVGPAKFGKSALNLFTPLAAFDRVYTTAGLDEATQRPLLAAGVRLEIVRASTMTKERDSER